MEMTLPPMASRAVERVPALIELDATHVAQPDHALVKTPAHLPHRIEA